MSETEAPLLFAVEDGVALLTLNRPHEGNSLSPDLLVALEAAWARVDADEAIRVAVLTGAGTRHFCTGASVGALEIGQGGLQNIPYARANRFSPRQCHVEKPVICVLNGLANGGGLHFVADCDIIIGCEQAALMDSHVNVGQVSALESQGLARRSTLGSALLLGLAGKAYRMPAARAHQLGIIDLLEADAPAALAKAMELARAMALNSPQAMALTKRSIWAATEMNDPASLQYSWELLKSHWAHPDFREGPQSFGEKRAPVWNPDPNARG
ncbi:MAG: enoyl-CoA hydratase/isomerase family protein [Sphingomonas sp.]